MDLNYLFYRHQISLVRAGDACCGEARHAHQELARRYAQLIERDRAGRPPGTMPPASLAVEAY